jgi:glycosyltransferase involved in cell wall biosynthesis
MERFALMLYNGFRKKRIDVELCRPPVRLGKLVYSTAKGLGKWMGYIDKWLLFPLSLMRKDRNAYYHICDHSNAFYLKFLPANKTSITCHDVLAIKGALGDKSAYCEASFTGKLLQKWILNNLRKAKKIAAVSCYTLQQLKLITGGKNEAVKEWKVIYNGYNQPFEVLPEEQVVNILKPYGLSNKRFLLHVGSALPRKNRKLLIEMLTQIGDNDLFVVFAGKAIDEDLKKTIHRYQIENRCIAIEQPQHTVLNALYNSCEAFIFPSFAEGFGWPVIEAQACGAPVIASNLEPMTEIGGEGVLYADPNNTAEFISCLNALKEQDFRASLIKKGFENTGRFSTENVLSQYLHFITTKA